MNLKAERLRGGEQQGSALGHIQIQCVFVLQEVTRHRPKTGHHRRPGAIPSLDFWLKPTADLQWGIREFLSLWTCSLWKLLDSFCSEFSQAIVYFGEDGVWGPFQDDSVKVNRRISRSPDL